MDQNNSKKILFECLFYVFLVLTAAAFIFHLFGSDLFESTLNIKDPPYWVQQAILGFLKMFELVFVYKLLIHKRFLFCIAVSVIQTVLVGFLPVNYIQGICDATVMLTLCLILRKDRGWAILDLLFVYGVMCLYGFIFLLARFGGFSLTYTYSFYMNIAGMIDYKLFVVTLYLYVKYKGGIKIWKLKRKLLQGE